MLCPYCQEHAGEKVALAPPFEKWRCLNCQQSYFVYEGYPVHPAAVPLLAEGATRCPVCGGIDTCQLLEAPDMGRARVYQCATCVAVFPALLPPGADGSEAMRDALIPVHPQAMLETITGVERMPSFYAVQQRLRTYMEQTGFVVTRSEDKTDLDAQVRSYTFYFAPAQWVQSHPERAASAQGSLMFLWHAGQAQFAGADPAQIPGPVPLQLHLGVAINPGALEESVPAYLRLVQGLDALLQELDMTTDALIDTEMAIHPGTQQATIHRLAAIRQIAFDMAQPAGWMDLIVEMQKLKPLLEKVWQLVAPAA